MQKEIAGMKKTTKPAAKTTKSKTAV